MVRKNVYRGHALRIVLGLAVSVLFILTGTSQAATITVCPFIQQINPQLCDYSSIKGAIDAASNGDTIIVKGGIYFESLTINKPLILRGVAADGARPKPVIDANYNGGIYSFVYSRVISFVIG